MIEPSDSDIHSASENIQAYIEYLEEQVEQVENLQDALIGLLDDVEGNGGYGPTKRCVDAAEDALRQSGIKILR